MRVPNGLPGDEAQAWVATAADRLRKGWAQDWDERTDERAKEILAGVVADRSDEVLLDLLFWPSEVPLPARVGVRAGTSVPTESWVEAGFEVSAYEGADIGPGLQCVAQQHVGDEDGVITLVHAQYVFVDGDESVVVTVEPTLLELFGLMLPGLHGIVGSVEVRRQDESAFAARPVPGYSTAAIDTWNDERDDQAIP